MEVAGRVLGVSFVNLDETQVEEHLVVRLIKCKSQKKALLGLPELLVLEE